MKRILVGMFLQMVYTVFCLAESNIGVLQASHTGYSGTDDVYQLWGWNILRYYYYLYRHLFVDYPWVVRVAYGVILVSCLGFAVIFCIMGVHVYLRRRNAKRKAWIKDRYFDKLKAIVHEEVENLSTEEISRRMEYKPRKWKTWEMRLWSEVLVELSLYTNVQNPNLTNIQRVMKLIGFTDYVERQLILGKRKDKVALMQAVRLTNMQLPDSIVASLVNDKDIRLRKAPVCIICARTKRNLICFWRRVVFRIQPSLFGIRWNFMRYLERYVKVVGRFLCLFLYCRKRRQPVKLSFSCTRLPIGGRTKR